MSERREFLKIVSAGSAGAILSPLFANPDSNEALADCGKDHAKKPSELPENIVYTKDHPGVWKGKESGHLPTLLVEKTDDGLTLNVETPHGMSEKHYIVRHAIVNGLGEVLGVKTFDSSDEPKSSHPIKVPTEDKGKDLFILSFCNLHDLWLTQERLKG